MSTAKIELHQARDFGKKLNATIEFIKENFKPLFKSMLYISGPFIALGSLLFIQVFSGFFRIIINETQGVDPTPDNFISMAAYGLGGFIFLLLGGTALIATVHEYIILYEKKGAHTFSVDDVWQKVKKSFFSVLGTMLVYALILAGGYTLIIVPTVFLGMVAPGLMGIVLIVSYVGLLYISVTFSLIFIIRAYEKVSIGKAISRCFYLIKGKWWSTFALIFVCSIIQSVVSSVFFIPWYANLIIEMLHNVDQQVFQEPSTLFQIINGITLMLYFICSNLMYSIPLIAIAFQYFNLVERKEARGLMSKIETFGTDQSPDEDDEEHY